MQSRVGFKVAASLFAMSSLVGCSDTFFKEASGSSVESYPPHACAGSVATCELTHFNLLQAPNNVEYLTRADIHVPEEADPSADANAEGTQNERGASNNEFLEEDP